MLIFPLPFDKLSKNFHINLYTYTILKYWKVFSVFQIFYISLSKFPAKCHVDECNCMLYRFDKRYPPFGKKWVQWRKPKMHEFIFLVKSKSSCTEQIIYPHTHTQQNVFAIYLLTDHYSLWKVDRHSLHSWLKFIPVHSGEWTDHMYKKNKQKIRYRIVTQWSCSSSPGHKGLYAFTAPGLSNGMDTPILYCIVK